MSDGTFITNGDSVESEFATGCCLTQLRQHPGPGLLLSYRMIVTMISKTDDAETIKVVTQAAML
jgi:hypothetical protein